MWMQLVVHTVCCVLLFINMSFDIRVFVLQVQNVFFDGMRIFLLVGNNLVNVFFLIICIQSK